MKVSRPSPRVLVVAHRRLPALLGLLVWIALVGIYYFTLFALGPMDEMAPIVSSERLARGHPDGWVLLLLPVIIAPYLVNAVRALANRQRFVFDGVSRVVEKDAAKVATFAQVRRLELRAVNGRCEELALCAILNDGAELDIHTGGATDSTVALAADIAEVLGVEVVRAF